MPEERVNDFAGERLGDDPFDIISTPFGSEVGKNKPGTVTQDRVKAYAEFGWFTGGVAMRLAELYGGARLEHD